MTRRRRRYATDRTIRDHVRRDNEIAPTAALMTRPIDLAEISRIENINDDRFRSLRIALGHYDVSRRYGDMLEERNMRREGIWCSFAVWSTLTVHLALTHNTAVARLDGRPINSTLANSGLKLFGKTAAGMDMLAQLGEGNRDVFVEMASELTRVADEIERRPIEYRADPLAWERYVTQRVRAHVRGPAFLPADRKLLREGVGYYYEAMFEEDDDLRSTLILTANLLLAEYEQRRLQTRIERAMTLTSKEGLNGRGVANMLARPRLIERVQRILNRYSARWVTRHAMVWENPLGSFRPYAGLPEPSEASKVPVPKPGTEKKAERANELLTQWLDPSQRAGRVTVNDWTNLDERMAFIAALFWDYQREPAFLSRPFPPRQTELVESPNKILSVPAEHRLSVFLDRLFLEPEPVDVFFPGSVIHIPFPQLGASYRDQVTQTINRLVLYFEEVAILVPEGLQQKPPEYMRQYLGDYLVDLWLEGLVSLIDMRSQYEADTTPLDRNFDDLLGEGDPDQQPMVDVGDTQYHRSRGSIRDLLEGRGIQPKIEGGTVALPRNVAYAVTASIGQSIAKSASRNTVEIDSRRDGPKSTGWVPVTNVREQFEAVPTATRVRDSPWPHELDLPCRVMPAPTARDARMLKTLKNMYGEELRDHRHTLERHFSDRITAGVRCLKLAECLDDAARRALRPDAENDREYLRSLAEGDEPDPSYQLNLSEAWLDDLRTESKLETRRNLQAKQESIEASYAAGRMSQKRRERSLRLLGKIQYDESWVKVARAETEKRLVSQAIRISRERKELERGERLLKEELELDTRRLREVLLETEDSVDEGADLHMYLEQLAPQKPFLFRVRPAAYGLFDNG